MLALFSHTDEPGLAQHLQVLRNGGLAEAQRRHDLRDADLAARAGAGALTVEEDRQDVASRRVRHHVEDVRHAPRVVTPGEEYHDRRDR
jgi:hypothetical protein